MTTAPTPGLMRSPRHVEVEITSRCNQRCRYCYYFDNPQVDYQDLPADEWLQFFAELGRAGVMDVTLQGGEPFVRTDLPQLIEGIVQNRMRYGILSNGGLIDDEMASFLASTRRCNYVQISIDGSRAETHDACRGEGTFEGAIRAVKALQKAGIVVAVRMTIHRHNVYDLEAAARFFLEDLGLSGFGTNSVGYLGTCRINADDVMLTTAERKLAMETLLRLNQKYGGRINAQAGPLSEGQRWQQMEDARLQNAPAFSNGGYLTACGCPKSKLAVRADGAMVPCCMLAHIVLGWINKDDMLDVWQHSPQLDALRNRHTIPLSQFDFCAGCPYIPYCTGNCPGLAYTMTGEVDHPSPDACLRRYLNDGGQIIRVGTAEAGAQGVCEMRA
jgi:SynChlorMet cassette radical SAM/SPASM protein ScmE